MKHRLAMYFKRHGLEKTWIFRFLLKINLLIFHRNEKIRFICKGEKNPDKVFYVIRGSGKSVGLCSHFITVINEAYGAMNQGYIPVVDFRENRTQYNMPYRIDGTWNAWEYYFEQISQYTLEEVYESKKIIESGYSGIRGGKIEIANCLDYSDEAIRRVKDFVWGMIVVKQNILGLVKRKKEELFNVQGEILGVFCRGTDYIALKPTGHPVQPQVQDVVIKTQEYLSNYPNIKKIFLATEDANIFYTFNKVFGDMCIISDHSFVENYDGKDYVYNYLPEDKYLVGRDYLIKMLLLAECDYLIASKASGAYFTMIMKEKDWKDKYIFELGIYQ